MSLGHRNASLEGVAPISESTTPNSIRYWSRDHLMLMAERFEEKQKNEGFGSSSLGRVIGEGQLQGLELKAHIAVV